MRPKKPARAVLKKVCQAIESKKGEEIAILDISQVSSFTDFFIICQGGNPKQNQAICDEIRAKLKKEAHLVPSHMEGYQEAEWILVDYLNFVVHIFSIGARRFYALERLWSDGVSIQVPAQTASSR